MCRTSSLLAFIPSLLLVLGGCQSREEKVVELQKQYYQVNKQFAKDCSAEMLDLPQKISPKCTDEGKKLKEAEDRLQAARAQSKS